MFDERVTPMFEPLEKLFHRDRRKVCHALTVFQRVTLEDLVRLDQAHAAGDWGDIGRLMHKMKSGCLQIGETAAADALTRMESELGASSRGGRLEAAFACARSEMKGVQERVAVYLESEQHQL